MTAATHETGSDRTVKPEHNAILARFGLSASDRLGEGSESVVYAIDDERVLRIFRSPPGRAQLAKLRGFLDLIDGRFPFGTPVIFEIGEGGDYTIERRLPGTPMPAMLKHLEGDRRAEAFRNYFLAVLAFREVKLPDKPYGELLSPSPITAGTWPDYLRQSLAHYVRANGATIAAEIGVPAELEAKALSLLASVDARPPKVLVHGDYFPGNVLMDDERRVSGVVDFGFYTVVGDPILDVAGAYIFLEMNNARPEDVELVRALVATRCGEVGPAHRFYRAYFAFAMADPAHGEGLYPKLYPWALENLRALRDGTLAF